MQNIRTLELWNYLSSRNSFSQNSLHFALSSYNIYLPWLLLILFSIYQYLPTFTHTYLYLPIFTLFIYLFLFIPIYLLVQY